MSAFEKKLKWFCSLRLSVSFNQLLTSFTLVKAFQVFKTMSAQTTFSYAQAARKGIQTQVAEDSNGNAWQFATETFTKVSHTSPSVAVPMAKTTAVASSVTEDVTEPSLCIPRVFPNITKEYIIDVLENYENLGQVERVDMVNKENERGQKFKRVFVHFRKWNLDDSHAVQCRQTALRGEMFQVMYDEPWFWKIGRSFAEKPIFDENHNLVVKEKPVVEAPAALGSGVVQRKSVKTPTVKINIDSKLIPRQVVASKAPHKKVSIREIPTIIPDTVDVKPEPVKTPHIEATPKTTEYQSQIDDLKSMLAAQTEMIRNLQLMMAANQHQQKQQTGPVKVTEKTTVSAVAAPAPETRSKSQESLFADILSENEGVSWADMLDDE
jgi:hypothetical protein